MDEFINKYRRFLLSSIFMLAGLLTAGYSVHYSKLQAYFSDMKIANTRIQSESYTLKNEMKKIVSDANKKATGISYSPTFLQNINEIARNNDVIIHRLLPDTEKQLKFSLEIITDYYTFIVFISELESLDTILDDIQVHPYDSSVNPPLHAISFSIIPRNDAKPMAGKRIAKLKEEVHQKDKRNPFQRFAFDSKRRKISPVIDLTWVYKLGGIGIAQNGQQYATINHQNYQVGDSMDGRKVTKISADKVYFEKKSKRGTARFTLSFRKKGKKR
ncbi:MAG: hypothetical protein HQL71_14400 [Magnetococcales bacterium]|nr:hypothetical protein [Magnetococcales bacterium]